MRLLYHNFTLRSNTLEKHSSDEWKEICHFETFDETLNFLYDVFFKPINIKAIV